MSNSTDSRFVGRNMFDTALQYFSGEKCYKGDRVRTLFNKAAFLKSMSASGEVISVEAEADRVYKEVGLERHMRHENEPVLGDFDSIVMIMSR